MDNEHEKIEYTLRCWDGWSDWRALAKRVGFTGPELFRLIEKESYDAILKAIMGDGVE